ncbi:uncharacterized protein LOC141591141 [Silene latifolia]|uniref:uncharacterized protein LOC141591141 n=1 Tax=Silene latifolia TaxID=37657 RepID=UPI003D774C2E
MRNLATCYSEHAVKVSDSYCSRPLNKSFVSPKSIPSIQNVVTSTYKVNISDQKRLFITITWCSKLICQGFFIKISENISTPSNSRHGFHQISKIKGFKSLLLDSKGNFKVDLHWDLSTARFDAAGPNPVGGFYVVLILVDSQSALVLGDMKNCQVVENLVGGLVKPMMTLTSQYEQFTGQWNNQINSKAKMSDSGIEHEIVIKCCPEDDGPRSPVLSVYVDKKRVVRVKKLQWNFRGNQVIFVDGLLVDVMWDVYGWYFDQNGKENVKNRSGSFMFRARSGLDSRLWLEEQDKNLADKNHDRPQFSLLICASTKNPS